MLVAVSGGGDSVALLHLIARMRAGGEADLFVGHLDHALRRGSASDRLFVVKTAARLGLPCLSDRRPVEDLRRRGESIEEAARRVRRAFLLEAAAESGASRIATGHTLDDQAETVLMRLARGAGPTALSGIRAAGPGPFVRPLLGIERAELRSFLARRGIAFREDPSNRSLRYDRNRVRRLVVPVLAGTLNSKAARHIVEAADRLHDDAAHLDGEARAWLDRHGGAEATSPVVLDASSLARLAPPVGRRVALLALGRVGADPRRIGSRHIESLLALASGVPGKRLDLPSGVGARVVRSRSGRAGARCLVLDRGRTEEGSS